MDEERAFAEASPMPDPVEAATDVYMEDGPIALKYGTVVVRQANEGAELTESSAPGHYK